MVEWRRIDPPFAERPGEVVDGRTSQLELQVVPRRARSVAPVELDGLRIALVIAVVVTPVADVEPSDEADIGRGHIANPDGVRSLPDDQELLVVASTPSHPLVEDQEPARTVDPRSESQV